MATALKINDDIATAARAESRLAQRSLTQQVEYWARLGRALERMPGMSMERIRQVLAAETDFDALSADERALTLGALETLTFNPGGDRALKRDKKAVGQAYTTLDAAGRIVEVGRGGKKRVIVDVDAYADDVPDSAA